MVVTSRSFYKCLQVTSPQVPKWPLVNVSTFQVGNTNEVLPRARRFVVRVIQRQGQHGT
ncbi:hypothetical protein BDN67DRAFT_373255 [Paxillus ammoniavirescens]|nr:hypothetical protein BDN67DRAFT_373255 [Paxillus ammoniavirescens]